MWKHYFQVFGHKSQHYSTASVKEGRGKPKFKYRKQDSDFQVIPMFKGCLKKCTQKYSIGTITQTDSIQFALHGYVDEA